MEPFPFCNVLGLFIVLEGLRSIQNVGSSASAAN